MKNNFYRYCLCSCVLLAPAVSVANASETTASSDATPAQAEGYILSGTVYNDMMQPVPDAILTSLGHSIVRTDKNGHFEMVNLAKWATVKVAANGYFSKEIRVTDNSKALVVCLIDEDKNRYNENLVLPLGTESNISSRKSADNLAKKDFAWGSISIDKALQGEVAGLQVVQKSGMTGEGAYMALRGIRSLVSETSPLIVINGVPYLPDNNESALIDGYSRSVFQSLNIQDIANISVLKGAEATAYGSMGSNGVIMIETDGAASDNLDTKITFSGSCGVNWNDNSLPLMNSSEYKSYLSDIGMSYYGNDMGAFFNNFAFMSDPNSNYSWLYRFDTDWQKEIKQNSLTHDYLFRVEGGDAIAKYDISLSYTGDEGTLKGTSSDRYAAQINSNVMVSKEFTITASINLDYLDGQYKPQGMSEEINPQIAAYRRSPLLSLYKASSIPSEDGSYALLKSYSSYYFGSNTNTDFLVSNPMAIVNTLDASIRQYDLNAKVQLDYKPSSELAFNALVGIYTNYDKEKMFIPGMDNSDIMPLFDQYGQADNTVRVGEGQVFNMFYGVNGMFNKTYNNRHHVAARAGFQVLTTTQEYDLAVGRNTPNDFYQTMGDVESVGRYFDGYNNAWNWMNGYFSADYTYGNWATVGVVASADGASSTGKDIDRMHFYPAVKAAIMVANLPGLNEYSWLDKLDVYADYSVTGNSRYSSKFGKYYYTSQPYQTIAGIIRANVPNTKLDAEKDKTFNVGVDMAGYHNRLNAKIGYYNTKATDVLMLGSASSAMGTSPYYCNDGKIESKGMELSLLMAPYVNKNFRWTVGGNLTTLNNEVTSMGKRDNYITPLSDGAEIITMVGENPYSFYGYQTSGVYATTSDAKDAHLTNRNSVSYQAGDVHYVDQNNDGVINDKDKVVLGSSTPDFFGSFFTNFEYKGWALDLNFVYSRGNKAYNAVRRSTESSLDFANQSKSVIRRWQNEGDITDMPRATYGDVIGNNDFSDRFVEDASYLKLRDVTVSYTFNKPIWHFIQSGTIYVTGQNLICFTDYLGLDPEYSYSYSSAMQGVDYAKVSLPKSVKLGVNLKF